MNTQFGSTIIQGSLMSQLDLLLVLRVVVWRGCLCRKSPENSCYDELAIRISSYTKTHSYSSG